MDHSEPTRIPAGLVGGFESGLRFVLARLCVVLLILARLTWKDSAKRLAWTVGGYVLPLVGIDLLVPKLTNLRFVAVCVCVMAANVIGFVQGNNE
jgi:hypothetical protein